MLLSHSFLTNSYFPILKSIPVCMRSGQVIWTICFLMLFLDYSTNKNTRREKNRFVYMYNLYTKNIILCCITFYLYRIYSCGPLNCLFSRIIFHNLYKKSPSFPCELTSGVSVYVQCRSLCYTLHMYTVVLPLNKSSDELPGLVLLQSSYDR